MDDVYLGAYATQQDAEDAKALRKEPQEELSVVNDSYDQEHPWRIKWTRS